jgi:hypothetical protein
VAGSSLKGGAEKMSCVTLHRELTLFGPLCWRNAAHVLIVIGSVFAGCAEAQTVIAQHSEASPAVGQVSLSGSPLSQASADNQPRFTIVPSVRTVYDSNVLRSFDVGDAGDNVRVTPGIDFRIRRAFGRVALTADGSAGYDFNSRYRFLNRSRIDFGGTARAPVGAICSAGLDVQFRQFQFELDDTQETVGSSTRNQSYSLTGSCPRAAGFSPIGSLSYSSNRSNGLSIFDSYQFREQIGVSYAKPGLGTLALVATAQQLRRPNIADLIGFEDGTDIRSLLLGLTRAVSPRIRFNLAAGITEANPTRAGVENFVGASYDGKVEWLITPRFVVSGTAARAVSSQNGIGATYVIREDYGAAVDWQVSGASRVGIAARQTKRDFRGEDLNLERQPIGSDEVTALSANYSYAASRSLRLGFGLSHRWRDAENSFYDYEATVLSSSIGTQF